MRESFTTAGVLHFFGTRTVKRCVGARAALADLRAGRLDVFDSFDGMPIEETAAETVSGPGAATCADSRTEGPFPGQSIRSGRNALELGLTGAGGAFSFASGGADALRTRCPGPASADVLGAAPLVLGAAPLVLGAAPPALGAAPLALGAAPLAAATLPLRALAGGPLSLTFGGDGTFTASGYTGRRGGSVVLSLVFTHASGGTRRVPVFPPLPRLP